MIVQADPELPSHRQFACWAIFIILTETRIQQLVSESGVMGEFESCPELDETAQLVAKLYCLLLGLLLSIHKTHATTKAIIRPRKAHSQKNEIVCSVM